jgi:hypothetical protein
MRAPCQSNTGKTADRGKLLLVYLVYSILPIFCVRNRSCSPFTTTTMTTSFKRQQTSKAIEKLLLQVLALSFVLFVV